MEAMIMAGQLLLSLSILVTVHEWGHYIAARMFGIRVERFYIFFDFLFPMPNVLNFSLFKYKRGHTQYGIGWFPLGGYVKIAGMADESMDKDQIKKPPKPWEFRSKPAWQRLIVMLGGIFVNVAVGVLIFVGTTYWIGDTYIANSYVNTHGGIQALELGRELGFKTGDKVVAINEKPFVKFDDMLNPNLFFSDDPRYTVLRDGREIILRIPSDFIEKFTRKEAATSFVAPRVPAVVGSVMKGTPAERLGLQPGDRLVEINGRSIAYQDEIREALKHGASDSTYFTVRRAGERQALVADLGGKLIIGFYARGLPPEALAKIAYTFVESLGRGTQRAFGAIFLQLKAFKKIFSGDVSLRKSLSGPIGIAQAFGPKWDWGRFWRMTALLSMVLAFMNLLPIPALDGGHAVFLIYEMATGRELSEKFSTVALKIGMAMLLLLMIFVFYNDIVRLFSGG